jgi:hypothetical protein
MHADDERAGQRQHTAGGGQPTQRGRAALGRSDRCKNGRSRALGHAFA